jgi:hypothetical protein
MGSGDDSAKRGRAFNQTHIGSVIGQVHSGSGDIHIGFESDHIFGRDDFLVALGKLIEDLRGAALRGDSGVPAQKALEELSKARQEAAKDVPEANAITQGLEKAKEMLVSGTGAITAAGSAVTAIEKLLPVLQSAIHYVPKIFGG